MYHNGRIMAELEAGPFFFLSKVESGLEARLWDQIFTWTENQLGIKFGTSQNNISPSSPPFLISLQSQLKLMNTYIRHHQELYHHRECSSCL